MRKEYYLLLIFLLLLIYIFIPSPNIEEKKDEISEKRAIFISYNELGNNLRGKDEDTMKKTINNMLDNIKNYGFNMVILQVRSFSDAIYYSDIFPSSRSVVNKEGDKLPFDILKYFIKKAHNKKLELHAWINPYRISNTVDTSLISPSNKAYEWLNTKEVAIIPDEGIYYNPASSLVLDLILEGIEEIIKNYDVDGIHFDDYFYPNSTSIDSIEYKEAKDINNNLSLKDYRLSVISSLIRETYKLIKSYDKDILFGISPDGNIDNNYNSNYVDTKLFATKKG